MFVFILWVSLASFLLESNLTLYVAVAVAILVVRAILLFFKEKR